MPVATIRRDSPAGTLSANVKTEWLRVHRTPDLRPQRRMPSSDARHPLAICSRSTHNYILGEIMTAPRHMTQLAQLALLVAAVDLTTKYAAVAVLSGAPVEVTDWLSLAVVHNDKGVFGLSLGAYTRQLNLALTLCAIAMIVPVGRDLERIDRWAPTTLGLILGGALGNLTSLILSARGVVDFIAIRTGEASAVVMNVADIAAYTGLALLLRTTFLLVGAIRREQRPVPAGPVRMRDLTLVRFDRQVTIPIAADGTADRAPFNQAIAPRLKRRQAPVQEKRFGAHPGNAQDRPDELAR